MENDFVTERIKNEVGFSATPVRQLANTSLIVPVIKQVDQAGIVKKINSNLRILYYSGVKTLVSLNVMKKNSWEFSCTSGTTIESSYPQVGHLDDYSYPTFDLNFGIPNEVYWEAQAYTNGNLYNIYHKQYLEEIIDRDSKVLTAFIWLTVSDIKILDFRSLYRIDGHLFRLQKIIDYTPTANKSTKCEFIKIKSGISFTVTSGTVRGGINSPYIGSGGQPSPIIRSPGIGEGNSADPT